MFQFRGSGTPQLSLLDPYIERDQHDLSEIRLARQPLLLDEIVVDNFACGGGASEGIEMAIGRPVDYAINHNAKALAVHLANHPHTVHLQENMRDLDPRIVGPGKRIALGWFSPDCTYYSKARGGKPFRDTKRARRVRGLPGTVVQWARIRRPRVIMLENVAEFKEWGPLLEDGTPCKARRGNSFRRWHKRLENLGYQIDMRELHACDYGAPTWRKRLFVIARCDGEEIVFPEPTHGHGLIPYGTAAECIDWSVPCQSIFDRKKPHVDPTCRRIARGIMRYVVHNPRPYIKSVPHQGGMVLGAPTMIQTGYGERKGQAPRCLDLHQPLGTVVAQGNKHAVVVAFLARHYGGHENDGAELFSPIPTITTKDHHALVTSRLVRTDGTPPAGRERCREVREFLIKHHGLEGSRKAQMFGTAATVDPSGAVVIRIQGKTYRFTDIGMRWLVPRELARAHAFRDSYVFDPVFDGKPLSKSDQIWMVGNSVPPVMSEALVRANLIEQRVRRAA